MEKEVLLFLFIHHREKGGVDITEVVIPFFKKHSPHGMARKNDFTLFCKIFHRTRKKKHLEEKDIKEIEKLKEEMHK